jgi:hypothetical protein
VIRGNLRGYRNPLKKKQNLHSSIFNPMHMAGLSAVRPCPTTSVAFINS